MQRTSQQNNSLHLYFRLLAQALNDAGMTQDVVLSDRLVRSLEALISLWGDDFHAQQLKETLEKYRPRVGLSWTEHSIKLLWKKIQLPMTNKEHTSDLTTGEVNRVYQDFDARISEITGVSVQFPKEEDDETE